MPRDTQIIPFYSQPHVGTYINDNSFYDEDVNRGLISGAKPYDTIMVTGADKGLDNTLIKLSDYPTKVELFGKGNYQKYGQSSIQADALLRTELANVWYMRVLPKNAQYANLAVIAHYRIAECIRDNWSDEKIDATDTSNDCEIKIVGGTPAAPVLVPTGLKQVEVKYSVVNVTRFMENAGIHAAAPLNDSDIENYLNGKTLAPDGTYVYNMPRGPIYTVNDAKAYTSYDGVARTPADLAGYYSVPLFYTRSIGRGKYGNKYALRMQREQDFEYDYDLKAYGFALIEREAITKVKNVFTGTMVTSTRLENSTLIDDITGAFQTGTCPIRVKSYEDNMISIFEAYRKTTKFNARVVAKKYPTDAARLEELEYASALVIDYNENGDISNIDQFDPIFGYRMNDTTMLPYYQNFTVKDIPYAPPALTLVNYLPTMMDVDHAAWDKFVAAGNTSLIRMVGDNIKITNFLGIEGAPITGNEGDTRLDKVFRIKELIPTYSTETPTDILKLEIVYNEGVWVDWNEEQFNGLDLGLEVGQPMKGGYDGEFEEILAKPKKGIVWSDTVGDEVLRAPNEAEMKLLLSREYVSAFRGEKDKYILSPARVNLNFIIDADYNVCDDLDSSLVSGSEKKSRAMFANSMVLTSDEYLQLHILDTGYRFASAGTKGNIPSIANALNVKKALYELNNYRNKNGMAISKEEGAGCELKLDCGLVSLAKTSESSTELKDLLRVMSQFEGRNTSVDFGNYVIIDPTTKRKINVTTGYFLAEQLVTHIAQHGPNKPFANTYATIRNIVRNSFRPEIDMIDWDVKEMLYKARINYYVTYDEGSTVQRACQNTCQRDPSAMLEESHVRVLNILKKGLDRSCQGYLYEWNEATVRKGYTDTQMEIYRPWIGDWVKDLDIRFDANEYEQGRMMMHCYADVSFRDIIKRISLEIDIRRPNATTGGDN